MDSDFLDKAYQQVVSDWQARNISSRKDLAAALDDYRIRFAYNSGHIENPQISYHDTRAVFEDGRVVGFTGDPRTLFEIQNLRECHEVLLDAFAVHRKLDEDLVLECHRTLTQGTYDERRWRAGERPGSYKRGDYVVGSGDVGATPDEVPQEMSALIDEVSQAEPTKPLVLAAYFHDVLENIHPFADGNGRCGRALMNYLLVCLNHPPIIVFEDDRMPYYGAIEAWDTDKNLVPTLTFLRVEAVKTWRSGRG